MTQACDVCGKEYKCNDDKYFEWFNGRPSKTCRGCTKHGSTRLKAQQQRHFLAKTGRKKCTKCGEIKPLTEFDSLGKDSNIRQVYCKECTTAISVKFTKEKKNRALFHYGSRACDRCGYDTYEGALDFHHRDPSEKEFGIAGVPTSKLAEEVDKCVLLCANCHRELHGGVWKLEELE